MKTPIDLAHYKRRRLFEAFKDREVPCFSTTVPVDITTLMGGPRSRGGFFLSISFLISRSVNRVPELRHRIIDGELFEFDTVDPAFTVLLDNDTFSFCDARHFETFASYREYASARIQAVRQCPDQEVGDKHHMFFISNLPWFSFTSITHPYYGKYASIPIVTIGKYFDQGGRILLPVGLQVHHALVDGVHVGKFYDELSSLCQSDVPGPP